MPRKELLAEGVEVQLGDCRELLGSLPVDDVAIVADPPYGIGHVKQASGRRVPGRKLPPRRNTGAIAGDAQPFDPVDVLRFPQVLLWGANHFCRRLPDGGRWLAWDKKAGSTLVDSFSDVEFAWHSHPGASRIFSYLWKGVQQDGEKGAPRLHPTQKPVALMAWCIDHLVDKPATIIDPYCGSGTTGVAAVRLGRRFTGIEVEERYFDVACRRISEALKQPHMFVDKPKPAKQQYKLEI